MSSKIDKINFDEAEYFYKSPYSLVDYSSMQSFSLIKSTVEVFAFYNIDCFSAEDIKLFFEKLQLVQKRNGKLFYPSVKKISGVLDCCIDGGKNSLEFKNGLYYIISWDSSGYGFELDAARRRGNLKD